MENVGPQRLYIYKVNITFSYPDLVYHMELKNHVTLYRLLCMKRYICQIDVTNVMIDNAS